jgi:hypothetical protein
LASLPCALLLYMRVHRIGSSASMTVLLLGLYLSTDWFFVMAFMAFRLAIALDIVCLALADMLRRRWSKVVFASYVALLCCGYLIHLGALVFFAAIIGISALVRLTSKRTTVARESWLLLPVAVLLLVHFGWVVEPYSASNPPAYQYYWGDIETKLRGLLYEFERFDGAPARPMMLMLGLCLLLAVWKDLRWRRITRPIVLEQLAIAAAFLALYVIFPRQYEDSAYVDVRALPMIVLFGLLACLHLPDQGEQSRRFGSTPVRTLAGMLAAANFIYLVIHMGENNEWAARYRQIAATVPMHARVLPVHTLVKQRDVSPFYHVGSFLVIDRGSVIPFLFSQERGDAMKYFRYKRKPYMPHEGWYRAQKGWDDGVAQSYTVLGQTYRWRFKYDKVDNVWRALELVPVDWNRIACQYDWLLVTKPFESRFIRLPARQVASNETAALLALDPGSCDPSPQPSRRVRLPLEH